MKKRIVIFILNIMLVAGCTTVGQVKEVHRGMTRQDVILSQGEPDESQRIDEYEILNYTDRIKSEWSWKYSWSTYKTDYHFVLKDNQLAEWGQGNVIAQKTQHGTITLSPQQ